MTSPSSYRDSVTGRKLKTNKQTPKQHNQKNQTTNFLAEPSILPGLACGQGAIPNLFSISTCKVIFTELHSQAQDRDCNYLHISGQ